MTKVGWSRWFGHAAGTRQRAERRGRWAELVAVLMLGLRGYRVLARRMRTRAGEIDIVAVRGHRLAFVEVKYRAQLDVAEASVGQRQSLRLHAAAAAFVARHPGFRHHEQGFDAVFLAPDRLPHYARDYLGPRVGSRVSAAHGRGMRVSRL